MAQHLRLCENQHSPAREADLSAGPWRMSLTNYQGRERSDICKGMEKGVVRSLGWKCGRRRDWRSSTGTDDKDLN